MTGRVRVAAHDEHPRQGVTVFRQYLVADALADIIEGRDALFADKVAGFLVTLGIGFVSCWNNVIEDDDIHPGIGHPVDADLEKGLGNGRGVVVGEQFVRLYRDNLPGNRLVQAGFQGEELFGKGLAHLNIPLDTRRSNTEQA